jgi:glycosyltransferase involved in cell wall biosynthesis
VATDADGLAEVLRHDVNALVVPRRDASALARAIIHAIDSPDERARLAAGARRTADAYDIGAFVRKMERMYDVLVRESRPRRRHVAGLAELAFLTEQAPA